MRRCSIIKGTQTIYVFPVDQITEGLNVHEGDGKQVKAPDCPLPAAMKVHVDVYLNPQISLGLSKL